MANRWKMNNNKNIFYYYYYYYYYYYSFASIETAVRHTQNHGFNSSVLCL